jgi:DNA replication and repair protein RecF
MLTEAQEARWSAGAPSAAASWTGRAGVTRLALTDFRNYSEARLALNTGPVVLTGPNGSGKTNLLEAVSLLAPGRGLRGAKLTEIDRHADREGEETATVGRQGWAVVATVETRRGAARIGTGRTEANADRRVVRIDGEPARSQAALGEQFGVIWLTPQMDRLFLEGPGGRRRFLDRLVAALDPAHPARVGAYEQALRQRARLLRDGPPDPVWLGALEDVMAAQGIAVAAARCDAVRRLDHACAEAEGPFPRARLALTGVVEAWLHDTPALAAEAKFATALAGSRRDDAVSGVATIGPHRTDLAVRLAPSGIRAEHASTGEQKALLISILLAHAELQRALRGDTPLMLLDEISAHLDPSRRLALFELVAQLESQVWLTGTDEAVFAPLRREAQFLSVHNGAVV